jgi:hypothetical protein
MRFYLSVTFILLVNFFCFPQRIPIDKQKHLVAGAVIGSAGTYIYNDIHPVWNAILVGTMAGVGKEAYDILSERGVYDTNDIYYTIVGGALGGAATYSINKLINKRKKSRKRYIRL